jgi:hypothetical protein
MTLRNVPTGRPRKAPHERRDQRLPAPRVTAAERSFVERLAAAAGFDVAEYIRRRALGYKLPTRATRTDALALLELNRVGVNLNQITARFHVTGELGDELQTTLAEIRAAVSALVEATDEPEAGHGS